MNNKKNIDRLFQEKFKDFDVVPNDAVWDRINESLPNKKKKRRVIALWWQIGGVAAAIALLLTAGISVFNFEDQNKQEFPIVNTEDKNNSTKDNSTKSSADVKQNELNDKNGDTHNFVNSDTDKKSIKEAITDEKENSSSPTHGKAKVSNQLTTASKNKSNAIANTSNKSKKTPGSKKPNEVIHTIPNEDNTTKVAEHTDKTISKKIEDTQLAPKSELESEIKNSIENKASATVVNSTSNNTEAENTEVINTVDSVITEIPKKVSIEDAIAEQTEVLDEKEKEDEQNRWSIAPNVAPVYYSSFGQGSSLNQQFNDNAKGGDVNMSYGITSAYAVSKKLKIRAGINRVSLNQTTSDVFAFAGPGIASRGTQDAQSQASGNITYNKRQNVLLMSSEMLSLSSAPEAFNTTVAGDIDQRFGFIEVPLELEYRLLDKTFGINLIGGFSTLFLNENEIYADLEGVSTLIGEANNINSTSFSANFGLGFDYSLSKQWNINLEPQFKYQINTFNNTTGDFRPFFIGVYTGLSFKF